MLQQFLVLMHVLISIALIALVLIQQGKGADIGASFGSGASQTVFGSQGSSSFLLKLTSVLAALFFATSLFLTYMAAHSTQGSQFMLPNSVQQPAVPVQQPK